MKIKTKIILLFTILAILGAGFGYLANSYFLRIIITETIGSYNALLAEENVGALDRIIYRRLEELESYVASNSDLTSFLEVSNKEFDKIKDRDQYIKIEDEKWSAAVKSEITPFMKEIINNNLSNELRLNIEFYNEKYGYDIFPELFATNKYGVNIAQTGKTTDYYQADEEWWQKNRNQKYYVGDIGYDESTGTYSLELGVRVDDKNGNFLGILKSVYNVQELFDMLGELETPIYPSLNAYLLTDNGKLIYSIKDGIGGLKDYSNILTPFHNTPSQNYYLGMQDGVEKLFAYASSGEYKDFKGLGWHLVVTRDTSAVLAPLNQLIYPNLLFILLIVLLVLLIGFFVSRIIIGPLDRLKDDVLIVGKGDMDHEIKITSGDEIGQLAQTFSRLVKTVKDSQAEVEKKVLKQTKEIQDDAEDLTNQKLALLNVLEDIEEEKKKVTAERDKVDTILHSIGDGVFVVDKDMNIIIYNEVAAQISGYSAKEAIGKNYKDILKFVFEKDNTINDAFIKKAMSTSKVQEMASHTLIVKKDGSKVPVADSCAPLKDEKGKVIGCMVVFRDVTKEREIDRMKTEFVSVASHQLRTPLTGIKWFVELLLKNKLSPTIKDYVKQIATSNERMVHLVDDLLNVSRIETGRKFDIVPVDVDLVPIVKQVVEAQQILAKSKKIKIICAIGSPSKLMMKVDGEKIRQVLQNLINNAYKYSKEGGRVEVGCKKDKKDVEFYVKDNGLGIPKKDQQRIFEKFFRAENALTAHTDGTGLGLYIVKAIVEAHGGKVWFESMEGKGTTFYFSLPIK